MALPVTRQVVVFDAADLSAESQFWAGLLGGRVVEDGAWHSVVVGGAWVIGVQHAPDHVEPQWSDGVRVHLDLFVSDLEQAHAEAMQLGARLLKAAEDPLAPEGFQVYADPAGHPFCLCWEP
jgi:predicted enzyme related to lactoylglutathione lyase